MRPVISVCAVAFIIIITCCDLAYSRPFLNLFNVAIKTDFTDEGNIVSFVYPKNKYQLQMKFSTEKVNEHSFNLGGLFQSIARNFRKRISSFNPFKFLTTSTTTEAPLDFSDEEDKDDSVSTSNGGVSSALTSVNDVEEEVENDSNSNDDSEDDSSPIADVKEESSTTSKPLSDSGTLSNGYEYPDLAVSIKIEPAPISYLPPSSSYLPVGGYY